jgi:delta14-sterol reductase
VAAAATNAITPAEDFGGPIGCAITTVALPCIVVLLSVACDGEECIDAVIMSQGLAEAWSVLSARLAAQPLVSVWALKVLLAWLSVQATLERLLFADVVLGTTLRDGSQLRYRMNGHLAFWVTMAVLLHGFVTLQPNDSDSDSAAPSYHIAPFPLHELDNAHLQLSVASIVISAALSVYLYASSFKLAPRLLAVNSGYPTYDFFMGRELNPRLLLGNSNGDDRTDAFDLKVFCELRPGLIGWVVLNLGMLLQQAALTEGGGVSAEMISINLFQAVYVWDALYHERAILTTMDITTDGFGFMLAFGDLAWVPFTYSLQARYLVHNSPNLSHTHLALIWVLFLGGYAIFRGSNSEKDAFRRDPTAPAVQHLQAIETQRGTRLLTSGYWGLARKINYTGDWIMGLSWCLLCGSQSIVPYFYSIYFGILLVHRAWRDDHACAHKYGADWQRYKAKVPFVFVPGLI